MAFAPEIQQAVEYLERAHAILHDYLVKPIENRSPVEVRQELLRRVQAAEHIEEASRWVKRLDPRPVGPFAPGMVAASKAG